MNLEDNRLNCQVPALRTVAEGNAPTPPESLSRRFKLMVRRRLRPSQERALKRYTDAVLNRLYSLTGRSHKLPLPLAKQPSHHFQPGDRVRVRPLEEIRATLSHWGQLKGCTFMPEMIQYCGTVQRVLKPMKRFVDERDLRVKKSSGIILLEGVMCRGTAEFGSCDRSCFYFWREEWLKNNEEITK